MFVLVSDGTGAACDSESAGTVPGTARNSVGKFHSLTCSAMNSMPRGSGWIRPHLPHPAAAAGPCIGPKQVLSAWSKSFCSIEGQ
jgi:hypothetical protein